MRNDSVAYIRKGRRQRFRRWFVVTGVLIGLACLLCMLMLLLGNTIYPINDVIRTLMGENIQGVSFAVNVIRLPRMIAGFFAGFAFGVAGTIFQTLFRNPLANPNVLGITAGSSAAAVFCIVIFQSSNAVISSVSFFAGILTVAVIYGLSKIRGFSIGRLILIGIGVQAMFDALISYLLLVSDEQNLPEALRWLNGSLNGSQMDELPPLIISVLIFLPIVILLTKHLSILELGDQSAISLGVHTDITRMALVLSSVAMISLATSTTGPIAFISFLAGPIAKRLVGSGLSTIIPAGFVGANLVLAADLIGQFAFHVRFPVGVITGIIGAPYLIYLLIRMNQRGEL